ncbi:uncharacterized protein C6orf47 homolog [Austrofundulus limnaeus]|uniref:Uncharacterized protein C6orf47 homolog n=1 Tax=Austrofundulus limnaeus TaxID=52670 RepID=A0A2I4CX20_AUSLI|nr:PREDICTED: uncharacterized protein C6orf47 homolog [Austrofundulus limnaeus]
MTAVLGRAWGWVRAWGSHGPPEKTTALIVETPKPQEKGGWGLRGWTSWMWRKQSDHSGAAEEFWEAQEKLQPVEIEELRAGKLEAQAALQQPKWWSRYLPTLYLWPRKPELSGLRQRKGDGRREHDIDGDFSDYGTPPPSPTPFSSQLTSPFRLFAHGWNMEIVPEHYDICFNFLRHLFDLFVVAFLWTVSPPAKLVLEVLGVQGALRLWFHGMAMFFVSTAGMAGLLWLIQEYLPQFALIYGIIQALVISVSVRQSVFLGVEEGEEGNDEDVKETDEMRDTKDHGDNPSSK